MNSAMPPNGSNSRVNPYNWLHFGSSHLLSVQVTRNLPDLLVDRIFLLSRWVGTWCDDPSILNRIANDAKLEMVWKEMSKHKRLNYKPTDTFVHQVRMAPKTLIDDYSEFPDLLLERLRESRRNEDAERLRSTLPIVGVTEPQLHELAAVYLFRNIFEYAVDANRPYIKTESELRKHEISCLRLLMH
jgi:hypothetical protein